MLCQINQFWNRPIALNFILWGALLLFVQSPAFADQAVTLTWNPSPNANVAGYKIYFGGASRVYTNSVTLGIVTNVTISGLSEGTTYFFGATTLDVSGIESDFSNEATYDIPQTVSNPPPDGNQPPTVDAIANLTVYQNAGLQTVPLTGITSGSTNENQTLLVSVDSSDPSIIPVPTVNYASPDSSGTLTFAPAANALGTTTVTLTVDDGGASNNLTTQTFTVTVVPVPVVNQPPTLNAIGNVTIHQNAGLQSVALSGITSGSISENQTLQVSAVSSNPGIIPAPNVAYTSPNNYGALTFAPATNAVGITTVTVTVDDGGASNNITSQTFTVTVLPDPAVNQPPTLDPVANVTVIQNAAARTISLTGITSGSPTENQTLRVSATSSNPRLVPASVIRYLSPANTALLTFKPVMNSLGVATITVTVNAGGRSNNIVRQIFKVNVVPNQPPTLDAIANVTVAQNAAAQTISLTGITSGSPTENQTLRVSAASSNPHLVSAPMIQYASPANTALLTFKPTGNGVGVATITVTVNDGANRNNIIRQRFKVTVAAPASANSISSSSSVPGTLAQSVPVVSFNPAATLTTVASAKGQFSFQVTGVAGGKYVVQATADLIHWTSVQTNTAPFTFQDNTAHEPAQRFYRAYYLP